MPVIIGHLIGGLVMAAGSLVGRVLIALGFGFASYSGFNFLLDSIRGQITSLLSSFASSTLVEWAGFFMIDKHLSLVLSAISVKVLLNGLTDGKKFITRK